MLRCCGGKRGQNKTCFLCICRQLTKKTHGLFDKCALLQKTLTWNANIFENVINNQIYIRLKWDLFINNIYYSGSWTWNIKLLCEKQTLGFTERKLWIRGFIKGTRATASAEGMPSWTMEKEREREEKKSESTGLSRGGRGEQAESNPIGYGGFWQSPTMVAFPRKQQCNEVHRAEAELTGRSSLHWEDETTIRGAKRPGYYLYLPRRFITTTANLMLHKF